MCVCVNRKRDRLLINDCGFITHLTFHYTCTCTYVHVHVHTWSDSPVNMYTIHKLCGMLVWRIGHTTIGMRICDLYMYQPSLLYKYIMHLMSVCCMCASTLKLVSM